MAEYQVIDKITHDAELKSIGDSIRAKGGTTAPFNSAAEMKAAVDAIQTGGGDGEIGTFVADGENTVIIPCTIPDPNLFALQTLNPFVPSASKGGVYKVISIKNFGRGASILWGDNGASLGGGWNEGGFSDIAIADGKLTFTNPWTRRLVAGEKYNYLIAKTRWY